MKPIFIIGITGRSGTHYLRQLLSKHNDVEISLLNREDHFVSELNYLELYVKNISYYWKRNDKEHENEIIKNLKIGLGSGILKSVPKKNKSDYYLINTPYTHNINLFPDYFPNHKMIILTRDAKDLVESGVRSKFWNYEEGLELWDQSAKRIIEFQKNNKPFIVKYEDLFTNTIVKLNEIFAYLDIKSEGYPFDKFDNIPTQGSSDAKNENNNWEYKNKKKGADFKPLNRSENWSFIRNWRFDWKCGENAENLDYKRQTNKNKYFYYIINIILDIVFSIYKIKIFAKHRVIKYLAKR